MSNHPPIPQVGAGFSALNQRKPRWDDKVPWFDIPKDGQWHQLRFIGNIYMTACHWLETKTGKRFPLMCPNYDSATQSFNGSPNPITDEFDPKNSQIKKIKDLTPRQSGFIHAIVRSVQMQGSTDPKWRPWRPVRVPMSVIIQIKNLTQLNTHLIEGKTYTADVTDPYYGKDVLIMYDPNNNPNQRYTITFGNHTPLNQVEMTYLQELFEWSKIIEYPSINDMKQSLQVNGYYQLLNGGAPAAGMPGVQDQVMQHVPAPPPAYQMATINPTAPAATPVMQPPGFAQPFQQPMAPQPQMPQQPVYPQPPVAQPVYPQPPVAQPVYPAAPAPQPVYPTAPAPQQPMVAPAPIPQFAPPPVQNMAQPVTTPQAGVPPLGESNAAPVAGAAAVAVQVQPQVAQPQPQLHLVPPVQAAVPADRRFQFPGKPDGLTGPEFQGVISKFAEALPRANPLKVWDNGDAAGLQVLNCYGSYKGDPHCIRCPLRRYCLQY